MERIITTEMRHVFTAAERMELGDGLAASNAHVYELKGNKTLFDTDMNAQIKTAEAKSAELTMKMRQGFEMRDVEALLIFDKPKRGFAQIIERATGEVIESRKMTAEELQGKFEFDEGTPN